MNQEFNNITVNSFKHYDSLKIKKEQIDLKQIFEKKNEQKLALENKFKQIYNNCVLKIKESIKYNKTNIIYSVPIKYVEIPDYKPSDCINYIEESLVKIGFIITKINESKIMIEWVKSC